MPHFMPRLTLPLLFSIICSAASISSRAANDPLLCPAPAALVEADTPIIATKNNAIEISSDEAELGVDGNAELSGNVIVRQGQREIRANDLQYSASDSALDIKGALQYRDPALMVKGTQGRYSAAQGGNFSSAEFQLRERGARGTAESLQLTPNGVINLETVKFTTCPASDEAWRIRSSHISLDPEKQLGTGRGTRLDFKGIPLAYLPWFSFPLSNARKSGFLFPSIGHSNRSGLQVSVPYYWNIAPNIDFSFEPVFYSQRGLDTAGELRYLAPRYFGNLDVNYLAEDQLSDDSRYRLRFRHRSELPHDLRLSFNASTVSDSAYFEDFAQGTEGTSIAFLERFAQLSYRDEHWQFNLQAQNFQVIARENLLPDDRPYSRVPRLQFNGDFALGNAQLLRYGFDSELVNFQRSDSITGWRLDSAPYLALDLRHPGFFLRPQVSLRHTQYTLNDQPAQTDQSPTRTLPVASIDTGLIFERSAGSQQQRLLTLEPNLRYLYVPFREQSDLPLFDTALPDLNLVQLFRDNRYVGADRISDANQASIGITSRLLDSSDGRQFLAATIGQIRYFETPEVALPDETARDNASSDFIAQLALTAFQNWNADIGLQWNPDSAQKERAQLRLQYQPAPGRVLNAGYRFQRDRLEQLEFSGAWPLSPRWQVFARYIQSLQDDTALERFAGFEYRSCCWGLRLLGRRFVSRRTGEQDTGVFLQLELNGLASVGSAADTFLANSIRGYEQ
jgi:LPS-assembly protein